MIHLSFALANPFSAPNRFKNLYNNVWFVTENKNLEVEFYRSTSIISFSFNLSAMRDHAGLTIDFDLIGYGCQLSLQDKRHWDYDSNDWGAA
jgi:hypothetical protein